MKLTIEQALQRAVEAHKAGKLQDAESLYRAILQTQPKHPDANHNLGVLAVSLNNTEAALPLFQIALEANPNQGQFWLSYLDALFKEKQFDNARNLLEQGKKRGLSGEKVDLLEAQLVQLDIYFKSRKTEPNKLSKAVELRETGKYHEAQNWLTKFLEIEPTDAEGWSLLSQLFLLDKKDAESERVLSMAISINAELPSIYRNQARLLLKNSKPAEALLKAQSGLEKSTEDPESLIVLAACLGANQRDSEALHLIEKALKARPNYAEAFVNKGLVRLRAKNTSGAIEDFEKACDLKPHLTQIWELLGTLRYQNRNLSGAIEALKKAQALEPDNVNRMINLGEFLRQDQRIGEAIAILKEATEKAPENADAWINLGTALQQDNKIENAQAAYKKALAINPNSAEVCNNLGSIAKGTKNWESARKYFEQAITIKSDLAEVHSNLGVTLQELGRLEDAETSYKQAIAIKPEFASAHYNLGITLQELGRLEDAEASYKKAIAIKPEYAEAHYNLGNILQELSRLEDAEASYKKVIVIKPEYAEAHYNLGNTLKQLGRLEDAETSYKKAISINPDLAEAHYNLGNILQELSRLEDAEASYKKAIAIKPEFAEAHSNLGITLKEFGRLEDAKGSFKKAIAIKPEYSAAHYNLGNTLKELGRLEDAEASYKKAIVFKPEYAAAHSNLGNTLKELGRLEDAETSYKKAISINPDLAEAHSNLGNTLQELGRLEDAEESFKKAIATKPEFAEAHYNLGNTLKELGRLEDAEASYSKAIVFKPEYAAAHSNLGITLQELGRLEDAEESFKKAIAIKPDFAEAHSNLGNTLKQLGRLEDALVAVTISIKIKHTAQAKSLFIDLTKKIGIQTWDPSLSQLVITALLEPWGRPSDVMPFAMRLLSKDREFSQILNQSKNDIDGAQLDESLLSSISEKEFDCSPLMQAMLASTPIADAQFEKVFTNLRAHQLKVASSLKMKEDKSDDVAALYCLIAQQCFINEYVYFQNTDEIDSSQNLRDLLSKALEEDQNIPLAWVIAVACYFPLYSIAGAEKLLHKNYSSNINSILIQQIQEPLEELKLRKAIRNLTSIENEVSLKVQSQYEENPYPRWTRLPKESSKKYLNSYIQSKFPFADFQRLDGDRNPEILIAGCGTGQHSIGSSLLIKGAKILAVDLSMASLSYAKRKTAELDIDSIEYAQADLLKLNSLGRTFDVIESSGVLHHLENPFDGWKVLLSLLRPYGLMKLGFYSELARRDIVRVRNLISSAGIGSSSQDIRGYRKHLLGLKNSENYGYVTTSTDFFSTSACRDLLFHVQEHRMNLRTISKFIKDQNLTFLGFEIDSSVIQAYKKRFLNDMSATKLEQWHTFEEENPDTFIGMYQFYVQRKY